MKALITLGMIAYSLVVIAQTKVEKTFALQNAKQIELSFDYPELIRLHTWNKNEILVKGSVSINKGENDDAFQLLSETKGNSILIRSEIRDRENLPKHTVIKKGDKEYFFKSV